MPITKETFMMHWFDELWNKNNEKVIDDLMAHDCIAHGLGPEPVIGRDQFRQFYKAFRDAYVDLRIVVEKSLVDGDYLVVLCDVKGTHKESGNPINFFGSSIGRIGNGQLVEAWNCFDFLTLNIQNGKIRADQLL